MEKFYWNPSRDDRVGVCMGIFKEDKLGNGQVETLVDQFPNQVRLTLVASHKVSRTRTCAARTAVSHHAPCVQNMCAETGRRTTSDLSYEASAPLCAAPAPAGMCLGVAGCVTPEATVVCCVCASPFGSAVAVCNGSRAHTHARWLACRQQYPCAGAECLSGWHLHLLSSPAAPAD